jgi:hypothetical protein
MIAVIYMQKVEVRQNLLKIILKHMRLVTNNKETFNGSTENGSTLIFVNTNLFFSCIEKLMHDKIYVIRFVEC